MRSTSLDYAKKALSHFMPDRNDKWNHKAQSGNPTQATEVNDVIKYIRRLEVRHQGKPSQARLAFTAKEYCNIIAAIEAMDDDEMRLFLSAIFRYQYNMGARIDDSSKKMWGNLKKHTNDAHSLYALISQLCWSKNIFEERQAPDQILFGAANRYFCVLVGLASWLEYWLAKDHYRKTPYLFGINGIDDPETIKRKASDALKKILGEDDTFDEVIEVMAECERKLGTHSMRKFATTIAAENWVPNDAIDCRYVPPSLSYFFFR